MDQAMLRDEPPPAVENSGTQVSGEVFGALINLAGRQRMLSQRIVLNAVLAAQGQEMALEIAREALALFRDSHDTLVHGKGELPGVFFDELRAEYFGPTTQGDKQIREFMELAEHALNLGEANFRAAPASLVELGLRATPIVGLLNRITVVYENESRRHAMVQKRQHHEMMNNIQEIAKHARMVSFNAQIVAARAGNVGREFAVIAGVLTDITSEIDDLVRVALKNSLA